MSERMYPIQDGPSVPWSVMAPHEGQCQKNHGQSIERIAERGGFGCSEAWCVINGIRWFDMEKSIGHEEAKRLWIEYAEHINNHYAELDQLKSTLTHYESALKEAKCSLDACHAHTVHGEVMTRDECHLCKTLATINKVLETT